MILFYILRTFCTGNFSLIKKSNRLPVSAKMAVICGWHGICEIKIGHAEKTR
jgi:hypothetical protein